VAASGVYSRLREGSSLTEFLSYDQESQCVSFTFSESSFLFHIGSSFTRLTSLLLALTHFSCLYFCLVPHFLYFPSVGKISSWQGCWRYLNAINRRWSQATRSSGRRRLCIEFSVCYSHSLSKPLLSLELFQRLMRHLLCPHVGSFVFRDSSYFGPPNSCFDEVIQFTSINLLHFRNADPPTRSLVASADPFLSGITSLVAYL
jgi:hypothetical protein